MNIFLIGFMGSGKTTFGKYLAKSLNLSFVDMDQQIELEQDLAVQQIFEKYGEDSFRKLEKDWLKNVKYKNTVISVGGGTPCFLDNMDTLLKLGFVVYLKMPNKMLVNRLQNAKGLRPLIEPYKDDTKTLSEFVRIKLSEREPFYTKAHLILENYWQNKGEAVDLIAENHKQKNSPEGL